MTEEGEEEEGQQPLSINELEQKLEGLQADLQRILREKGEVEGAIKVLEPKLAREKKKEEKLKAIQAKQKAKVDEVARLKAETEERAKAEEEERARKQIEEEKIF